VSTHLPPSPVADPSPTDSPVGGFVQDCADLCSPTSNRSPSLTPDAPDPLTPQQRTAIALLVGGNTALSVAARLGVHRNTIFYWKQTNPHFRRELDRLGREATEAAAARLRRLLLAATGEIDAALRKRGRLPARDGEGLYAPTVPGVPDYFDAPHADRRLRAAFRVVGVKRVWDVATNLPPVDEEDASPSPRYAGERAG